MIFLARGAKCGGLGAIGLGSAVGAAANARRSFISEASAIEPRPSAHRLKNWRRVKYCAAARLLNGSIFLMSVAQVSNLLYRRFPIGRPSETSRTIGSS